MNTVALPIEPEVIVQTAERLFETLDKVLKQIKAPEEVSELVRSMDDISHYNLLAYTDPEALNPKDPREFWNCGEMMIDALNAISRADAFLSAEDPEEMTAPLTEPTKAQ